jgi:hypothetical protein
MPMSDDEDRPFGAHRDSGPFDNDGAEDSPGLTDDDPVIADLGATLRAALAPHRDVRDKARHRVDRALQARSAAFGLTSMGSCAIDTVRHLLTNRPPVADRTYMTDARHTAGTFDRTAGTDAPEVDHD